MSDCESRQSTIKIYNWKFQPGDTYMSKSPIFSMFVENIELKWQLHYISRGIDFATGAQMARDSRCILKYYSKFRIHVVVSTSIENVFDPKTFEKCFTSGQNIAIIKYGNAVNNPVIPDAVPSVFNLLCKIEIDESKFIADLDIVQADKNTFCRCTGRIMRDFECLIDDEKTGDVILRMDNGEELHAHKALLSSQSPVFAAMFNHDMLEKRSNIVEIKGISYDLMKQILLFIYAGKVGVSEEILSLESLYVAADMYCLDDLKNYCSRVMIEDLNARNAVQYLELAHIFKDERLKTRIMKFVVEQTKEIVNSKEFQQLQDADLIRDIFVAFVKEH